MTSDKIPVAVLSFQEISCRATENKPGLIEHISTFYLLNHSLASYISGLKKKKYKKKSLLYARKKRKGGSGTVQTGYCLNRALKSLRV